MDIQLINKIRTWQKNGSVVVLATGVFDILHIEHVRFLKKAKAAGDKLLVGTESDIRVRAMKGDSRPLNNESVRIEQLQAIRYVDYAFVLPQTFNSQSAWERFMQQLKPDIYAVSSHTSHLQNKQQICDKFGIEFKIVHQFNPSFSSSALINALIKES